MNPINAKMMVNAEITVEQLAQWFCGMSDDDQAQFFVMVAAGMDAYEGIGRCMQLRYIGNHLRDCACSTESAREWISELAEIIKEKK